MFIFLTVVVALQIFIYIFAWTWFGEIGISFLPYIILFNILVFAIGIGYIFQQNINIGVSITQKTIKQRYKIFLILLFAVLCILYYIPFRSFYQGRFEIKDFADRNWTEDILQSEIDTQTQGIKVLYANIWKDNKNYDDIKSMVEKYDPDIILFVEFSDHHDKILKSYLSESYPYINRTTRSEIFVGSMVFSRIPLTDIAGDFHQGAWRYGYFKLDYDGQDIYFYLVHTSSPTSLFNFKMRNKQLSSLFSDFEVHKQNRPIGSPVLMMGDFNISPWAVHYRDFIKKISLKNKTRDFPIFFTWKNRRIPFMRAHIDHLFTSSDIQIYDFKNINIQGSDHRGFVFEIR